MKGTILAAGLGTRLRPLTYVLPKPLLPLGEKTILERIIEWLRAHGIREIFILTYYMSRMIENYLGDGGWLGVDIRYVRYPPRGTAGQLYPLRGMVDETLVVVNGDTITDLNLREMINFHVEKSADMTLAVKPMRTRVSYGVVEVRDDGVVKAWREKPEFEYLANIGVYILEPNVLKLIPDRPYPMNLLVEEMLSRGMRVYAYITTATYHDVGTYDEYVKLNDLYSQEFKKI